jgi:hypothetical protein
MRPTTGAVGVGGWALITALPDTSDVHPSVLVTAKLYVPEGNAVTVVVEPVPLDVMPPGYLIRVHSPFAGMFSRRMLPVASSQVGWVMVLITGGGGVTG